jgi:hypothetical protein
MFSAFYNQRKPLQKVLKGQTDLAAKALTQYICGSTSAFLQTYIGNRHSANLDICERTFADWNAPFCGKNAERSR